MEPKKLKRELVRTAISIDIMCKITEVDLGSRGQTKDFSRRRCLSELYNKKSGSKRGHV